MGNVEALLVRPVTLLSCVFVFIVCKSLTERQGYLSYESTEIQLGNPWARSVGLNRVVGRLSQGPSDLPVSVHSGGSGVTPSSQVLAGLLELLLTNQKAAKFERRGSVVKSHDSHRGCPVSFCLRVTCSGGSQPPRPETALQSHPPKQAWKPVC